MSACAPKNPLPKDIDTPSSQLLVPFIAPRSELCASSSIEMLALYWHSKTSFTPALTLGELDERTLIPAKGGTLQIELIAAARADGLIAYPLRGGFESLTRELFVGHPLIVLVNRSFAWYPLWHYATLTGYNAQTQHFMTHFAKSPDELLSYSTFTAIWERSEKWGVILLPPGELPLTLEAEEIVRSIYEFESVGKIEGAIVSYETAYLRWPKDTNLLFALANAYYKTQQLQKAETIYKDILSINPAHALARNNLADLLCSMGRSYEALNIIEEATSKEAQTQSILNATHQEILQGCKKRVD
ncbi:MAG: PA2778 family cysteine peptidase [Sulfurimonas sp.]|nr:PA2778 family cysteine peptidase [Sulfurimonas sp.]